MSIRHEYRSTVTVVATVEGDYVDSSDATYTVNGLNTSKSLTGATTPPVTKFSCFALALTAGAATIDLTALPGRTNDETVDGTGLKVQSLKVRGHADNANPITVEVGASNGYELLGADTAFAVKAGQEVLIYGNDASPDIASGDRILDVTGTGTQVLEVEVVMG